LCQVCFDTIKTINTVLATLQLNFDFQIKFQRKLNLSWKNRFFTLVFGNITHITSAIRIFQKGSSFFAGALLVLSVIYVPNYGEKNMNLPLKLAYKQRWNIFFANVVYFAAVLILFQFFCKALSSFRLNSDCAITFWSNIN
jgi:hypothetical protein